MGPATGDWPLLGRDAERRRCEAALRGDGAAVVLTGEAGAGKTRLAREVAAGLEADGYAVLRAVATRAASGIPFGALAGLLPPAEADADVLALLQRTRAAFDARAGGRPVLLLVDDAHALDAGSATLVLQLVLARALRLVVTVRSGERAPDAVAALDKDAGALRVEVGALGEDAVREVLEAALGPPVLPAAVRRLWQLSRGNPLLLRELVREELEAGRLERGSGAWALRPGLRPGRRLTEVVRARLGALTPEQAHAVELLAVGGPLGLGLLEGLVPVAALDDLEERGLVEVALDGRRTTVALGHPLYAEAVAGALPLLRRRRRHGELADALARTRARRREDRLRAASWQLEGDRPPAPGALAEAAEEARRRFDLGLAERLARAALGAGPHVAAGVVLAEVLFYTGRPEEAADLLAGLAPAARTDEEVASVADTRAHVLNLLRRDEEAWQVLHDAAGRLVDPDRRRDTASRGALLHLLAGRLGAALEEADEVGGQARPGEGGPEGAPAPDRAGMRAAYAATTALASLGRAAECLERAEAARRAGEGRRVLPVPEVFLFPQASALVYAGRPGAALDLLGRTEAAFLAAGDPEGVGTSALIAGRAELARGDADAALARFRAAAAAYRGLNDEVALRWCLGGVALALGTAGDAEAAATAAREVAALTGPPAGLYEPDLVQRGLAWACAAAGEASRARDLLEGAASLAAGLGQDAPELVLRHDLLRLGEPAAAARVRDLAGRVEGAFAAACALHAAALGGDEPRAWAGAAEAFAAAEAPLEGAEAALAGLRHLAGRGEGRRASALARLGQELLARCRGAGTPGLQAPAPAGPALTARELEVARLAARGLANADIAARLVLSRRTVENHLQRAFVKLGVTRREDLAHALGPRAPRSSPPGPRAAGAAGAARAAGPAGAAAQDSQPERVSPASLVQASAPPPPRTVSPPAPSRP
ncbi:LuxR C-terminal-related transcriptional regulator [Vallicoccus soli]|uniref:LuxR C-terminal-related transcriptional regulator n=1 Tax=Vallicoccus soli TaxID=2339232 RepID=UPI0014033F01|nr:LuxR family transcriptional regulator [Vallicoccus soli]